MNDCRITTVPRWRVPRRVKAPFSRLLETAWWRTRPPYHKLHHENDHCPPSAPAEGNVSPVLSVFTYSLSAVGDENKVDVKHYLNILLECVSVCLVRLLALMVGSFGPALSPRLYENPVFCSPCSA